jgi:hypothetical protein
VLRPDILSIHNSANLYVYCTNNPILFIDPSGLAPNALAVLGAAHRDPMTRRVVALNPLSQLPAYEFTETLIQMSSPNNTKAETALLIGLVILNTPFKMIDMIEKAYTGTFINAFVTANGGTISEFELEMAQVGGMVMTAYVTGAIGTHAATGGAATVGTRASTGGTRVAAGSTGLTGNTAIGGTRVATRSAAAPRYPGNNPSIAPGRGFEWRGSGPVGSNQGNWYNPSTREWMRPDLNHGPPIGPHWDYGVRGQSPNYRIFPNGSMIPKN